MEMWLKTSSKTGHSLFAFSVFGRAAKETKLLFSSAAPTTMIRALFHGQRALLSQSLVASIGRPVSRRVAHKHPPRLLTSQTKPQSVSGALSIPQRALSKKAEKGEQCSAHEFQRLLSSRPRD